MHVKLGDPLRMCAIPERLRGVSMTRRYTNPHLALPLPVYSTAFAGTHSAYTRGADELLTWVAE